VDSSAWHQALNELKARRPAADRTSSDAETFVGVQMADGSYISGYVVSYNPRAPEDEQREMILTRAEIRPVKGAMRPIGSTLTVIGVKQIVRLDVSYVDRPGSTNAAPAEAEEAPTE
jgi:hypothetical protein